MKTTDTPTRKELDRYAEATDRTEVVEAICATWETLASEGLSERVMLDATLGAVLAITTARHGREEAARLCERAAARLRMDA